MLTNKQKKRKNRNARKNSKRNKGQDSQTIPEMRDTHHKSLAMTGLAMTSQVMTSLDMTEGLAPSSIQQAAVLPVLLVARATA